jgi:uncharacterized membrane protein (UPF0127 family)
MFNQIFLFLLLSSFLFSENRTIPLDKLFKTNLKIKNKTFSVWLALNPTQQSEGLGFVKSEEISKKEGMFFIYPLSAKRTFWMKNTLIDLDIIFIKEDGEISSLDRMLKDSKKYYSSKEEVRYVLEFRAGVLKTIPLKVGDKIIIPKKVLEFSKP